MAALCPQAEAGCQRRVGCLCRRPPLPATAASALIPPIWIVASRVPLPLRSCLRLQPHIPTLQEYYVLLSMLLLTCSWVSGLCTGYSLHQEYFPCLLHLEKSCSSPKPSMDGGVGEGAIIFALLPCAKDHAER